MILEDGDFHIKFQDLKEVTHFVISLFDEQAVLSCENKNFISYKFPESNVSIMVDTSSIYSGFISISFQGIIKDFDLNQFMLKLNEKFHSEVRYDIPMDRSGEFVQICNQGQFTKVNYLDLTS